MKPKDYLLKHGHITAITRGRLSRENIAIINKAVESGIDIEGYSVVKSKPSVTTGETPEPVKVERSAKVDSDKVFDMPDEVRPEKDWEAYAYVDGKKRHVSMREVDTASCGNSFTFCPCKSPMTRVYGEPVLVLFSRRTKPFVKTF